MNQTTKREIKSKQGIHDCEVNEEKKRVLNEEGRVKILAKVQDHHFRVMRRTATNILSVYFIRASFGSYSPYDPPDIELDIENVTFMDLELSHKLAVAGIFQVPDFDSHIIACAHETLGRGVVSQRSD